MGEVSGNGISRRSLIVNGLAGGAAATLMGGAGKVQAATSLHPRRVFRGKVRNVVLVHGAYADGSSWSEVIERLQAAGVHATAVQNPLTSVADDVAATRRILARHAKRTVLVGHSYGGTVISEAGADPHVVGLVYVAARAPDAGEDYTALAKTFPTRRPTRASCSRTDSGVSPSMRSCTTSPTASIEGGRGPSTPSRGTSRPPCSMTGRRLRPGVRRHRGTPSPHGIAPPHRRLSTSSPSA